MNVEMLATKEVISITPEQSLLAASKLIKEHKIRHLPVVEANGALVGIVTDRDIKRASASEANSLDIHELLYLVDRIKVREVMTSNPVTVTRETSVSDAAQLMIDRKIGSLPVVEDTRLVGIVTEVDLLELVARGA